MIAITPASSPTDPVQAFNAQLAQAKLAALAILQNLATSFGLVDPRGCEAFRARELRLIAATILRTREITPEPSPPAANDPTPDRGAAPPSANSSDPEAPARRERASPKPRPEAEPRPDADARPRTPPPSEPFG